jgi:zinc transport system substrate-binding protein
MNRPQLWRIKISVFSLVLAIVPFAALGNLGAMPAQEQREGSEALADGVIATTAWTAAFVRLAGGDEVRVLAPYEMRHPPEYELKPSDIEAVARARLIVFAGYETMVEKLKDTAGRVDITLLQIDTRNDLATVRVSVSRVAAALGTEERATENLRQLEEYFSDWRREIGRLGLAGAPVLVHFFQQPLVRELGFEVKGVFGPGPLEPAQIVTLSDEDVVLIVDNWHNEIGRPFEETVPAARRVSWINFPGSFGTRSLQDVFDYNRRALREIVEQER